MRFLTKFLGHRLVQCGICLLVGFGLSIGFGQDANWDLRNYHLYTPYSLMSGRFDRDFMPADFQTFINPTLDFIYAYLALGPLGSFPRLLAGVMGFWFGGLAFLNLLFVRHLFGGSERAGGPVIAACAFLTSVTSVAIISQIGNTTNDIAAALVFLAGYLAISMSLAAVPGGRPDLRRFLSGSFLVGLASGLKLSMAVFVPPLAFALLSAMPFAVWVPSVMLCVLLACLGFLAGDGWWALMLLRRFDSPTFPAFNDFFYSPWAPPISIAETRFLPKSLMQWLFDPFYFAWTAKPMVVLEEGIREPRLALAYLLILVLGVVALVHKRRLRGASGPGLLPPARLILFFTIFAYVAWLCSSNLIRYAIPVEVGASLSLFIALGAILNPWGRARGLMAVAASLGVTFLCLFCSVDFHWPRIPFGDKVFDVDMAWAPHDALFVSVIGPTAYLAVFLPPESQARFVGFGYVTLAGHDYPMGKRVAQAVATAPGAIYVLYTDEMTFILKDLVQVGLSDALGPCRVVDSNLDAPLGKPVHACLAHRLNP